MFKIYVPILSLSIVLVSNTVIHAATINQNLDFLAPTQSVWGPGVGGADFRGIGSVSGLGGTVGIYYDIKANAGSVTAKFNGALSVDYNSYLSGPGTTLLNLAFKGDNNGGMLNTFLGASVDVDWFIDTWFYNDRGNLYSRNYSLDIGKIYTPKLDALVAGTDNFTVNNVSVGIPNIAEAGLDFVVNQTADFTADSVDGKLIYKNRTSGLGGVMPFAIDTNSPISLPINLNQSGYWDLYFTGMSLDNVFSTEIDLKLVPFIELLGDPWSTTLNLWDFDRAFPLQFNPVNNLPMYSIFVDKAQVSEPSTIVMFCVGLVGLTVFRRKMARG